MVSEELTRVLCGFDTSHLQGGQGIGMRQRSSQSGGKDGLHHHVRPGLDRLLGARMQSLPLVAFAGQ
jgi:hypothetical protein